MDLLEQFTLTFLHYCQEIWFSLVLGFLISGILYQFTSAKSIEKYLGAPGIKSILWASLIGSVLPVCCIGSLPIAITFRKKGASLGAILAFLVITPGTSLPAFLVIWKLLGLGFAIYICITVILIGFLLGFVGNAIAFKRNMEGSESDCCSNSNTIEVHEKLSIKFLKALKYSFITLPKEIGLEILLGISVASVITVFKPIQDFIHSYMSGLKGYFIILGVGLLTYVCEVASVPLAHALVKSGMTPGQAMCYLIAGPITSYATMLVIRKEFGSNVLVVYLLVISIFSLLSGICYDLIFSQSIY